MMPWNCKANLFKVQPSAERLAFDVQRFYVKRLTQIPER